MRLNRKESLRVAGPPLPHEEGERHSRQLLPAPRVGAYTPQRSFWFLGEGLVVLRTTRLTPEYQT